MVFGKSVVLGVGGGISTQLKNRKSLIVVPHFQGRKNIIRGLRNGSQL